MAIFITDGCSYFTAAGKTRVETAVGIVTDNRKVAVSTAVIDGITCDHNFPIALQCHASGVTAAHANEG